jgi:hypothetical protein
MKEHYTPPWRWADLAYAVVCVLGCIAIGAMLARGCVPLN